MSADQAQRAVSDRLRGPAVGVSDRRCLGRTAYAARAEGRRLERRGPAGRLWSVAVDVVRGQVGGVAGAEVGTVTAEDVDPLAARVVDGVGDEVGGVVVAAAGHADVRRGGAGGLAERRGGRSRRCRPGRRRRWWRRRARRARSTYSVGSARWPARPMTSRLPSAPMPATVQVSRLATPSSRSLRRVATRSPRPIRSPRLVTGSPAGSRQSPGGGRGWPR